MDTILECGNGAYEHCKRNRDIATPVTITPTLVGADLCTRGPAHWCSSLENMFECGIGVSPLVHILSLNTISNSLSIKRRTSTARKRRNSKMVRFFLVRIDAPQ